MYARMYTRTFDNHTLYKITHTYISTHIYCILRARRHIHTHIHTYITYSIYIHTTYIHRFEFFVRSRLPRAAVREIITKALEKKRGSGTAVGVMYVCVCMYVCMYVYVFYILYVIYVLFICIGICYICVYIHCFKYACYIMYVCVYVRMYVCMYALVSINLDIFHI